MDNENIDQEKPGLLTRIGDAVIDFVAENPNTTKAFLAVAAAVAGEFTPGGPIAAAACGLAAAVAADRIVAAAQKDYDRRHSPSHKEGRDDHEKEHSQEHQASMSQTQSQEVAVEKFTKRDPSSPVNSPKEPSGEALKSALEQGRSG